MFRNLWIRVAELFGISVREFGNPALILLRMVAMIVAVVAEEVLRKYFAPIIDIYLPGETTPLSAAVALGILLYSRSRKA
jgi:hypothetical protein